MRLRISKSISTTHSVEPRVSQAPDEHSILRHLREQKKLSRNDIAKMSRLSTYQVEGLEGSATQSVLLKLSAYVRALGCTAEDALLLMGHEGRKDGRIQGGSFSVPESETKFDQGVVLSNFIQGKAQYLGALQLDGGKSLLGEKLPFSGAVLGIVREGILVVDSVQASSSFKKGQFFFLPDTVPFTLSNGCGVTRAYSFIIGISPSL